jgi:hypothetical protein
MHAAVQIGLPRFVGLNFSGALIFSTDQVFRVGQRDVHD